MNKRIRELVGRAGGIEHDDDGNELTPALVGKDLEKFALLIVEECEEVVRWAISVDSTIEKVPVLIREHFGVEE